MVSDQGNVSIQQQQALLSSSLSLFYSFLSLFIPLLCVRAARIPPLHLDHRAVEEKQRALPLHVCVLLSLSILQTLNSGCSSIERTTHTPRTLLRNRKISTVDAASLVCALEKRSSRPAGRWAAGIRIDTSTTSIL